MTDFNYLVGAYIYRLHLSIDHALAVSYRRDVYGSNPKFVARITLVKGIPFYGFHVGYRFFLKIYLLNPITMTRLADLLQQGLIMNRKLQPYESHIQYLLQFMIDYNLYGCAYLETSKVVFRAPVPNWQDEQSTPHLWHSQTISRQDITDDSRLPRVSHCSIEVDICVQDILNRKAVKERRLHHDFIERLQPLPSDMKLVHSMAGLWKDETKRRKRRMNLTDPGSSPFPPEVLVSMSASPRDSQPAGWIHEEEYRTHIQDLITEEENATGASPLSFDSFVSAQPHADRVKTILQSIEDLFPENLRPALGLDDSFDQSDQDLNSSIVIDEKGILDVEGDQDGDNFFIEDSDEELVRQVELAEQAAKKAKQQKSTSFTSSDELPSDPGKAVDLPRGVCESGMESGKAPQMPIWDELLDAATEEGFYGRYPSGQAISQAQPSLKRTHEALESHDRSKKMKFGSSFRSSQQSTDLSGSGNSTGGGSGMAEFINEVKGEMEPPSSSQKKMLASRGTGKRHGNQTLNFAVVKDPHDPSTKLRLSQPTASQCSEDDGSKNHTGSDISFPTLESPSSQFHDLPQLPPSSQPMITSSQFDSFFELEPCSPVARPTRSTFVFALAPPSAAEVLSTMQANGLPDVLYQDAFYSREKDVPTRKREYAGREFRLESNTLPYLPEFDATGLSPATFGTKVDVALDRNAVELQYSRQRKQCTLKSWEIATPPPSFAEVQDWWQERQKARKIDARRSKTKSQESQNTRLFQSQIDGPALKNKHGFSYSQKPKSTSVEHEAQYMSTLSMEIHVNTRGKLVPNPEEDEVQCIFWCTASDENFNRSTQDRADGFKSGLIVLSEDGELAQKIRMQTTAEVQEESSELDLMVKMVEVVRTQDPDILTGYEVHGSSWGYLIERARLKYDFNLCDEFSRMKSQSHGRFGKEADRWGFNTTSTIRVTGRHMINVWRAMRGELNLLQYTMENVVWHVLHRRIPHYSWRTLTDWYRSGRPRDLQRVVRYYNIRTRLDIEILETNELIPRTSEQARLLGVDFFSVFSRGSQFKVESIMARIAKPENLLLISPSRKQVGSQNALECLPLVMEPQSAFFNSPLLVLDFQSLYPSVMIAYNYCYSTFLGRIVSWRGQNKMGFTEYKRQQGLLQLLKNHINIAPNGMMFAKADIRKSLLAKMLTEILETRVMVKSGMKQDKDDKTLQQLLNNRQLALKLLANVTYGYTSASFSGRMPCSEIADSIVQTARETLERSIAFIHSVEKWNAEVVYGDTDSLFVYLKGRTRDQAFDIGEEIAKAITDMNPQPVKLKFEKVYHPCVLLAKKRYVGYKYESRDQVQPEFDAKGIETVRRDGTPAEQKIEEKALRLLFETADLSQVKAYFQAQCNKIMRGRVSIQDFCYAREVRLGTYSDKGPPPPGALISTKRMMEDARAEPQYGERVPYVVITGAPGARLIDRCVAPEDLLNNPHCMLDAEYYISKNLIPPLERIFNLVGANVRGWYDEMPKIQRVRRVAMSGVGAKKTTLESYLKSASCLVCGVKMKGDGSICRRCKVQATSSMLKLQKRLNLEHKGLADVIKVCQTCSAATPQEDVPCDSKDCPVFYSRVKQVTRLKTEKSLLEPVVKQLGELGLRRKALDW
jgi:DNA polymerase zeta